VIQLFHVTKTYGHDLIALQEVSFRVERSEFVFLTGRSGAGKTTLLKLLFGAESATRGQILFDGKNITRPKRHEIAALRQRIGVVFQDFRLIDRLTAVENIALAVRVQGLGKKEARAKAEEMLAWVGLRHKADAYPPALSGGEKQRMAIARALVVEPVLLLADEPTGNLDPEMSLEILELFERINVRGTTVLLATHAYDLIQARAHRVLRLEKGRLEPGLPEN